MNTRVFGLLLLLSVSPLLAQDGLGDLPPSTRVVTIDSQGQSATSQLELSHSDEAIHAKWVVAGTTWEARCVLNPRGTRGTARHYEGRCRPVRAAGFTGALGGDSEQPARDLSLRLVVDRTRGFVRGAVITAPRPRSFPQLVHRFSGLLAIRVGDRWLPRLKMGPARSGLIDGLTANDPLPVDDDLPLPQPSAKVLGNLVVLVTGMFNMPPSHQLVTRLAAHGSTIVIAYANPYTPSGAGVYVVEALDGRRLAPELRGRVLARGGPGPLINSYPQTSDRVLEVFEALRASPLFAGDPLEARATLIGHSQGSLAVLLTRQRLVAAGFPHAVGKTVGLAPPYRGLSLADNSVVRWLGDLVSPFAPSLPDALQELRADQVRARIGPGQLDVAIVGFQPDSLESDGVVSHETVRLAGLRFRSLGGYDHAKIFQGPAVADVLGRMLSPPQKR